MKLTKEDIETIARRRYIDKGIDHGLLMLWLVLALLGMVVLRTWGNIPSPYAIIPWAFAVIFCIYLVYLLYLAGSKQKKLVEQFVKDWEASQGDEGSIV